ncbi:MAG: ROK family protein [Pseudothermotoga sp.]|nr:ROK family protein [Pseudothermotoga sp.]
MDILMNKALSRAELARETGLTKSTIGEIVREMMSIGILEEKELVAGKIGRPRVKLGVRKDWAHVIGISVERDSLTVSLIDSAKSILKTDGFNYERPYNNVEELLYDLYSIVDEFYEFSKKQGISLKAIGIGIPGPLDPKSGTLGNVPNFSILSNVSPKNLFEKRYQLPVWVGNDADMAALGERYFGAGKTMNSFIYVFLDKGIGAGIIINNELYIGMNGYAGEIGQLLVITQNKEVFLEDICSVNAVISKSYQLGIRKTCDLRKLNDMALKGDRTARAIIEETGKYVGSAILSLMYLFGISNIIMGGSLLQLGELFIEEIKRVIRAHLFHAHDVNIKLSTLGTQAISLGAAMNALIEYSIEAIRSRR